MKEQIRIAKIALRNNCKNSENFYLNFFQRSFYTFKFLICWFLSLHNDFKNCPLDGIEVASFDEHSYVSFDCMNARAWETVVVGPGIFTNWWCQQYNDTNC